MNRKEWLQKFLRLVSTGATMLDYRRELRLFPAQVKSHLKAIGDYRHELKQILEREEIERVRAERLDKARVLKEKRRLEREKKKEEHGSELDEPE